MSEFRPLIYIGAYFSIEWYFDIKGKSQARELFLSLSDERKASFLALVKRLGESGQIKDITKFRNEGNKIFAFKPQPERFLCFFFSGKKVIVTNAFVKKTNKLPTNEKLKAVLAKKDFEERVKKGNYYEK